MIRTNWLVSAALVAMAAPGVAVASSAGDQSAQADGASPGATDEIVVTAEKRSTTVMRTNIAVAALSGDDLKQHEIRDVKALQNFVPGLSVSDTGLVSQLNIRGIGLGITDPGVYSGVAIYRDNLFQGPIVANEPFYDIGSVQVLRGPQGTFVGNNSTGGALFVKTADPKLGDASGYASLTGGNYNRIAFEGAVNIPVSDTLAVRIAPAFSRTAILPAVLRETIRRQESLTLSLDVSAFCGNLQTTSRASARSNIIIMTPVALPASRSPEPSSPTWSRPIPTPSISETFRVTMSRPSAWTTSQA